MLNLRILSGFLIVLIVSSCGSEPICQNEIIDRYASPTKALEVVTFARNCGATTDENVQASIVKFGSEPKLKGNIFIGQLDRSSDAEKISVAWEGDKSVRLTIPSAFEIFLTEDRFGDVDIGLKTTR